MLEVVALIAGALLVPASVVWAAGSSALTLWHNVYGELLSSDGSFPEYYRRNFGRGVHFVVGIVLFLGLAAAQIVLAVWGYANHDYELLSALSGVRLADAVISHIALQRLLPGKNPGYWQAPVYIFEGAAILCLYPLFPGHWLLGSGIFVVFWSVSFTLRARDERFCDSGGDFNSLRGSFGGPADARRP